jgi:hypothetical protein
MNRLFLISGTVIFVLSISLIINTPNKTMAYSCSSSSSTHNVKLQTGLTGSSGGCAVSSSAATTSRPNGSSHSAASGPNNTIGVGAGGNCFSNVLTFNQPGHIVITFTVISSNGGTGTVSSASSGGSQASCSSSSATSFSGAATSSSSQSQPGSCP